MKSIRCLSEEENSGCSLIATGVFFFLIILLWQWLWPDVIPFVTFEFFRFSITDTVNAAWALIPLFCYGLLINVPNMLKKEKLPLTKNDLFVEGTKISLWAGIGEELLFRWLLFFGAIISISVFDWIFFGFMFEYGLLGLIYNWIFIPIANFLTFGYLTPFLYHSSGWVVGAAIVSANGQFRDGHQYQGCLGWLTSWFAGMIFFYLVFTCGIPTAIIIHFLYDFIIFTAIAITRGR